MRTKTELGQIEARIALIISKSEITNEEFDNMVSHIKAGEFWV